MLSSASGGGRRGLLEVDKGHCMLARLRCTTIASGSLGLGLCVLIVRSSESILEMFNHFALNRSEMQRDLFFTTRVKRT